MRPLALADIKSCISIDGLQGGVTAHLAGLSDQHLGERDIWFARTRMFERRPDKRDYQEKWWRRLKFFLKGQDRGPTMAHVMLTSIDRFVDDHGVMPDLIKIDVDGYEGKVIRGGLNTIAIHKPMIMLELHKNSLMQGGETRRDVVCHLFDAGYEALFLTDHHDRTRCRLVRVSADDPLLSRDETDFILLL